MDQDPNVNPKTKRRVIAWILFATALFFPIVWMLQPSADTPYSTALQVEDGALAVEAIHPLAPNPLERFGTDPLGRNVTTFVAQSLPQAMLIALGAAVIRTVLGAVFGRIRALHKVPFWALAAAEIVLYGFLFSLPLFRTGTPSDHLLMITLLLGVFFLPAVDRDLHLRRMGLTVMDQFIRVLLLLAVMGLLGRTVGANPYAAIPAAYPVTFTYPFLTNLLASVWHTGLTAWWIWAIPLLAVLAVVYGVFLLKAPMQENYQRRGVYFTNLARDFFHFLNPVSAVKELIRFTDHLAINTLRLTVLTLAGLAVLWSSTGGDTEIYSPVYADLAAVQAELEGIQTPEERIDYAENLLENSRINPVGSTFRMEEEGVTVVAGIRHGISRTQPLVIVIDVNADELTFELQTALYHAVMANAGNIWVHQSLIFVFTDGVPENYRSLLDISGSGFFAVMEELSGEPVLIDETLVYPGNSWAGSIASDFRYGFDNHGIEHELAWIQPTGRHTLRLVENALMGVQVRGGDAETPQETLDALTDAIMRYAVRDRRFRH